MEFHPLRALSPVDGRYWIHLYPLSDYFSEFSLFRYRLLVEIEYFLALFDIVPQLKDLKSTYANDFDKVRALYSKEKFTLEQAEMIKDIEKITNHDVKAVEYYLKQKLEELGMKQVEEWVHFGLTSQDINNTAIPLAFKHAVANEWEKALNGLIEKLRDMSHVWANVPMLARTHGQPATPTRLGKEIHVFLDRILTQREQMKSIPYSAKFGGATGQFNAHVVAFPDIDWPEFADRFVQSLGLTREQWTTQISHYDNLSAIFQAMGRINTILIDLCRDMWMYISFGYFKQKINKSEVGSSAMPHKVNPIDFENAEGNLGLANCLFDYMASKLPISRLQRDLTDSTTLRNIGVPIGHTLLAFHSIQKGLSKLILNEQKINEDLEQNWVVVSEAIQTILRREGFDKPYEALKSLTRTGEDVTRQQLETFINNLQVSDKVKQELKRITPFTFIGVLPKEQKMPLYHTPNNNNNNVLYGR
jgi:adenylosuccinate lyase